MSRKKWWQNPKNIASLEDVIAKVGGKAYKLNLSPKNSLGATSHTSKSVWINPTGLPYLEDIHERQHVRYAPNSKAQWQKKLSKALTYHEAAHIRYSNEKPCQPLLGWLWNALEDGRIEKLLGKTSWHIKRYFKFLGDAAWCQLETTSDLLSACLYWRWEYEYPVDSYKFIPWSPEAKKFWDEEIRPLVEQSWDADSSDVVTQFAEEILAKLSISCDAGLPSWIPILPWDGPDGSPGSNDLIDDLDLSELEDEDIVNDLDAWFWPFSGLRSLFDKDEHDEAELSVYEDDPEPLRTRIEGLARELAKVLNMPSSRPFPRPHRSQGELNLDRVLEGSQYAFDKKFKSSPLSIAILLLVDQSGSMDGKAIIEARASAMLFNRAVNIAGSVALGVWGFGNQGEPYVHRPLSVESDVTVERRIAGMAAWTGGTLLHPVFQKAKQALLERQEKCKLLILFTDAELQKEDAELVNKEVQDLQRSRIYIQPIFVGEACGNAKAANMEIFGRITACSNFDELIPHLCSWLRALLSR